MTDTKRWIALAGIIVFLMVVYSLSAVLTPFLVAALLAYLTDPLVNKLQRLKMPRIVAVIIVFLGLLLLFLMALLLLIPLLEHQLILFVEFVPTFFAWIQNKILPVLQKYFGVASNVNFDSLKAALTQHWQQGGELAQRIINTVTQSGMAIVGFAMNLVLIPVVMFYLLRDWHDVIDAASGLLPRRVEPVIRRLVTECDEVLSAFLRGQLLVMIALGILYSIGLRIVGINLSLLIGMIAGLLSIVPYLGFIVGIAAASIAAMIQFQAPLYLIYVVIVFAVAQSIESMYLTPKLIGDKIGLHPVAVIFAVLAGGDLFGFVGILLALPVAAVLMVFLRYFKQQYQQSQLYQESGDKQCHNS